MYPCTIMSVPGDLPKPPGEDADLLDVLKRKLAHQESIGGLGSGVDPVLATQRRARLGQRVNLVAAPVVPVAGGVGDDRMHPKGIGQAVAQAILGDTVGNVLDQRLSSRIRIGAVVSGQRQQCHRRFIG